MQTEYCRSKKISFTTEEDAFTHADFLRGRFGTRQYVYECPHCSRWHLTTQKPALQSARVSFPLGERLKLAVKPQKLTPAMERVLEDIRAGSELWSHHGRYWLQGAYSIKVNKTVAHALLTRGLIRLAIAGDSIKNSKWELVGQK